VLKTAIFILQVSFTSNFVLDCPFKLFLTDQILTARFYLTVLNVVEFLRVIKQEI